MRRHAATLFVIVLAAGLRLWRIDLAQFHDVDDVRDWSRAGQWGTPAQPWWLGPDVALTTGVGARLPGGLYYLLLRGARLVSDDAYGGLVLMAILGTLAVACTLPLARLFMSSQEANLAALVAATAPAWVLASRRIWNPGMVPLLAAAFFLFLGRWFVHSSRKGLVLSCLFAGLLLHLHLSALALVPLMGLAALTGVTKPRAALLGLVLLLVPLAPFLIADLTGRHGATLRIVSALSHVVSGKDQPSRGALPAPVSWPLPYLPPLSTHAYGDDFLDRAAASLLVTESPSLQGTPLLSQYWKGPTSRTLRSFRPEDLRARFRLHRRASAGTELRFIADAAASLVLMVLLVAGLLVVGVEALRGDGRAFALGLMSVPMLLCTRVPGVADSYHFYFAFFPLPALLIGRAVAGMGHLWRVARTLVILATTVQAVLLVDRVRDIERFGGTPTYGVCQRSRVRAAAWLREAGARRQDLTIEGPTHPWDLLLPPGRGPQAYRVVELGEGTLHDLCGEAPGGCGRRWLEERQRGRAFLVHREPGIWIYRTTPSPSRGPG